MFAPATCFLTVAQREAFNELANRDMEAESIRMMFDQEQWMMDADGVFYMTSRQASYLLKVWDIITPY